MTAGRLVIIAILLTALAGGAAMWWLQERQFYFAVEDGNVQLTRADTGEAEPVMFENFKAIDSTSSPIRYRACARLTEPDTLSAYRPAEDPVPLIAPRFFDCFDARAIGEALESGEATAYLGLKDVHYGVDRIWAVFPDGRAYGWQQINACGAVVFDGEPAPEGCPPPPEDMQ